MFGKPKTGSRDRMPPPGRNKPLGIKKSSPESYENRTLPGSDLFVIHLRH